MYLATWFQRTTLHLNEMRWLFNQNVSKLELPKNDVIAHAQKLNVVSSNFFEFNDLDIFTSKFENGMVFSAAEDGVLSLYTNVDSISDLVTARIRLEEYYRGALGPALSFLFSRGAPIPKQLSLVREAYPILLVVRGAKQKDIDLIFSVIDDKIESSSLSPNIDIYFGTTVHVLNISGSVGKEERLLDNIIDNIVFLREFEYQLHSYLRLHRSMWDAVSAIRKSKSIKYKDFSHIRKSILDFLETLSFVKARLSQMEDNCRARMILVEPGVKKQLAALGLLRFENLLADEYYVADLWQMTIEYVKGTLDLLTSLYEENTQRELSTLKFITFIAAVTSFFGMNIAFPWEDRWQIVSYSSFFVVLFIALSCFVFYFILQKAIYSRHFSIKR